MAHGAPRDERMPPSSSKGQSTQLLRATNGSDSLPHEGKTPAEQRRNDDWESSPTAGSHGTEPFSCANLRLILHAHITHENYKLQHDSQRQDYERRILPYEDALAGLDPRHRKIIVNMVLALGNSSAMVLLKQGLRCLRDPSDEGYIDGLGDIAEARSPQQRMQVINDLGVRLAHYRLPRRLHIYLLYTEVCRDVFGQDSDQSFLSESIPYTSGSSSATDRKLPRGNPRNISQSKITKRLMEYAALEAQGRRFDAMRAKNAMNRLRVLGYRLHLLKQKWGLGILALMDVRFTDDRYGSVAICIVR